MSTAKRAVILIGALGIGLLPIRAYGDSWRGGYAGVDLGVMQPVQKPFPHFVDTGGTIAPYVGYMFNDFLGVQTQLHVLGAGTDVAGPTQDGDAT